MKKETKPWIFFHKYMLENITYDDLHEIPLKGKSYTAHKCGYITEKGTILECKPYHHIDLLTNLTYREYKDMYERFKETCWKEDVDDSGDVVSCYERFFMIELGWVKVEAYISPGQEGARLPEEFDYDWKAVRIYQLTKEQQEVLFPR